MQVPQTAGILGWIVLSHENNVPVCTWITARECRSIPVCLDERLFGDTIFRAEKTDSSTYILSDVWIYNGSCIFASTSFKQRYDWIQQILWKFHRRIQGMSSFLHKSDVTPSMKLRGYEIYTHDEGFHGCFVDAEEGDYIQVIKTEIPDVYLVQQKEGYIRIPDLKVSAFMRSKTYPCFLRCKDRCDGSWDILENIPTT